MTVPKPTLTPYSPGDATGYVVTGANYNTEVLQQGARTQLLIEPVTAFPASPATTDFCNRSDLNALYQCTNATGPVWAQMSIGSFTTAARPAAPPTNFVYFDTTLHALMYYTGSTYATVPAGTQDSFTAATYSNSWTTQAGYPPAGYYKDTNGRVWLRGVITGGTSGTVAFTLPSGYTSVYNMSQSVYATTNVGVFVSGVFLNFPGSGTCVVAGTSAATNLVFLYNFSIDTRS